MIAGAEHRLFRSIPNRESEVAVKVLNARFAPLAVRLEDQFGVGQTMRIDAQREGESRTVVEARVSNAAEPCGLCKGAAGGAVLAECPPQLAQRIAPAPAARWMGELDVAGPPPDRTHGRTGARSARRENSRAKPPEA